MYYKNCNELLNSLSDCLKVSDRDVEILNLLQLETHIDVLIYNAIFNTNEDVKKSCRWLIKKIALKLNIIPSSIQELYQARGRGEFCGFTVPAINIRVLTYDIARSIFRSAKKLNAGAIIFEIARSEISYTNQRPQEYTTSVLAAAIKERYYSPIFLQGDHFQLSAKKFAKEPESEINAIRSLIEEAIDAYFFNIDIDTSTLVDITKPDVTTQQELNSQLCAEFTRFIRTHQPQGITISVGGEIGEVGGKNSTEEELRAFINEYKKFIGDEVGISKISVQTGTSHGGIPLADGTIAKVKLDFDTLKRLSEIARKEYGLAGAVQHGASTLPVELFDRFPQIETAEIHLATEFQNMVFDHPMFPITLKQKIYNWLKEEAISEKKEGETEQQFFYKTRKKALGPFKKEFWNLPGEIKDVITADLEKKFLFLFEKMNIKNTSELIKKYIKPIIVEKEGRFNKTISEAVSDLAD